MRTEVTSRVLESQAYQVLGCILLSLAPLARTLPQEAAAITNLTMATGDRWNRRAPAIVVSQRWVAFLVKESSQGRVDLNSDGDSEDWVLHIYDVETATIENVGLSIRKPAYHNPGFEPCFESFGVVLSENRLGFRVSETQQGGVDLNGDGDFDDDIVHVHDMATNATQNLGLAGRLQDASQDWLTLLVSESSQAETDLNGDGDFDDDVVHVYDLGTHQLVNLGLARSFQPPPAIPFADCPKEISADENWLFFSAASETDTGKGTARRLYLYDIEHQALATLDAGSWSHSQNWLAFTLSEAEVMDLNGDGDTADQILHVRDLESGVTTNLGLALSGFENGPCLLEAQGEWVVSQLEDVTLEVIHMPSGRRMNLGDQKFCGNPAVVYVGGDSSNRMTLVDDTGVLRVYDLESGATRSIEFDAIGAASTTTFVLATSEKERKKQDPEGSPNNRFLLHDVESATTKNLGDLDEWPPDASASSSWLAFSVDERHQATDLNGDGDDRDRVVHARSVGSGTTFNLRIAGEIGGVFGSLLVVAAMEGQVSSTPGSEGDDLNRDGDRWDWVLHVVDLASLEPLRFLRGDCDGDGNPCSGVNDALELLSWLFLGRTAPPCLASCDPDGNGELELADAVYGLNFCFKGTNAPVAPVPECGVGTEADAALGCETSACE